MLVKSLLKRIKATRVLFKKKNWLDVGRSYYPECPQKTRWRILRDELFLVWKYGAYDPSYFLYGFDRKGVTRRQMTHEYIVPNQDFNLRRRLLNSGNGGVSGVVLTADKFYFYVILERFGIPTPRLYCYIKNKQVLYSDAQFGVDNSAEPTQQLEQFLKNDMDAFCKPSGGTFGNGVFALRVKDSKIYVNGDLRPVDEVMRMLQSTSYIVQERLHQHSKLNVLCGSTINTVRIQTIREDDGNVLVFGAGLRIGREGGCVDNCSMGGIFVGIDMNKGVLMDRGFLHPDYGTSLFQHPDTKVVFKDFEVPYYKEVERLAIRLHKTLYRSYTIGWDIAITEDGPVAIEGNCGWGISYVQALTED